MGMPILGREAPPKRPDHRFQPSARRLSHVSIDTDYRQSGSYFARRPGDGKIQGILV